MRSRFLPVRGAAAHPGAHRHAARRLAAATAAAALLLGLAGGAGTARAQQQQEWFVPQGQQRPAQGGPQPQRPVQQRPAQQQQRPQAPPPMPAGERTPAPIIGIVDVQEVQRLSTAFNQVREEIERRRTRLNEDLQREQARWREEQQRLGAERASLSPEQLRTRERDMQDRVTDSQRIFRDRQRSIEQATQQALTEIEQALGGVIQQVAASHQVNLVLPRPFVIYNDPPFDLTAEVAAQLNRTLRSVTVPPEENAPATTGGAARPAQQGEARQPTPPARPAQGGGQQPRRN